MLICWRSFPSICKDMWTTLECAIFFADHMEERFAYSNQSVGVINDCSLTYRFSLRFQIVQKNYYSNDI